MEGSSIHYWCEQGGGGAHYCYGSCNLFLIKAAKKRRDERKILCYDCHVERGELSELTGKLWNGFMLLMDVNVLDFVAAHIVIRKKKNSFHCLIIKEHSSPHVSWMLWRLTQNVVMPRWTGRANSLDCHSLAFYYIFKCNFPCC